MTTDEHTATTVGAEPPLVAKGPSWWHRAHPVFTPLSGFFTGLLVIIVVPSAFFAVLSAFVSDHTAERLFPYVLTLLAIPLVLVAVPRTRRFGGYMLLGMVITAVVVLGVGALTLWYLFSHDG